MFALLKSQGPLRALIALSGLLSGGVPRSVEVREAQAVMPCALVHSEFSGRGLHAAFPVRQELQAEAVASALASSVGGGEILYPLPAL